MLPLGLRGIFQNLPRLLSPLRYLLSHGLDRLFMPALRVGVKLRVTLIPDPMKGLAHWNLVACVTLNIDINLLYHPHAT